MTRRLRGKLHATVRKQIVGTNQECIDPLLHNAREGCVNLPISASGEDLELPPNGRRSSLRVLDPGLSNKRIVRVDKHGKAGGPGQQFVQKSEPLGPKFRAYVGHSSDV